MLSEQRDEFVYELHERGIEFEWAQSGTGKINGYRVHMSGHNAASGEPVWFKGSQLARELSWPKIQQHLDDSPAVMQPTPLQVAQQRYEEVVADKRAEARNLAKWYLQAQRIAATPDDPRQAEAASYVAQRRAWFLAKQVGTPPPASDRQGARDWLDAMSRALAQETPEGFALLNLRNDGVSQETGPARRGDPRQKQLLR